MPKEQTPSSSDDQPVMQKEFKTAMEKIDQRFEKIDARFEKIDQRFEKIDQRFDDMTGEFIKLTGYIDQKAKETIETSERRMGVLFEEMIHRLETSLEFGTTLPPKIENHEKRISKMEEEIPVLRLAVLGGK